MSYQRSIILFLIICLAQSSEIYFPSHPPIPSPSQIEKEYELPFQLHKQNLITEDNETIQSNQSNTI